MESEKKFGSEMFGYAKSEVDEYIKSLKAEYESKLQAEKSDSNRIANELTIIKKKVERQEKVANALITAEDQARKIIEDARNEALQEKDRIEALIEMEREKLLDAKKEVLDLKEKSIVLMQKYQSEIDNLVE